jgi:hypothetical protein
MCYYPLPEFSVKAKTFFREASSLKYNGNSGKAKASVLTKRDAGARVKRNKSLVRQAPEFTRVYHRVCKWSPKSFAREMQLFASVCA